MIILGTATVVKLCLYFYCRALAAKSGIMLALAEDHRNDVMSNSEPAQPWCLLSSND